MTLHAVDRKLGPNRELNVPAEFRRALGDGIVLARGVQACVEIWPVAGFERYVNTLTSQYHPLSPEAQRLKRFFAANALDEELDGRGNVRIAHFLCEHAALEKHVIVLGRTATPMGTGGHLEVWGSSATWADDSFPALTDTDTRREVAVRFKAIGDELLQSIDRQPELLLQLSPRQFEELMADLYARQGFDVELTPPSKDGGVDLYVVQHTSYGRLLTVVDCKRYRQDRPIGVALVRELLGTVDATKASAGVLATTSYFTAGAIELSKRYPFRLGLQEFHDLRAMLGTVLDPLGP